MDYARGAFVCHEFSALQFDFTEDEIVRGFPTHYFVGICRGGRGLGICVSRESSHAALCGLSTSHCCSMAARTIVLFFLVASGYTLLAAPVARAETPAEVQQLIETRQKQIADLEAQISEFWKQVDEKKAKGASVQGDIEILKAKIATSELEIRSLKLAIEESTYKLRQTESRISTVSDKIDRTRLRLATSLRMLNQREEAPLLLQLAEAGRVSQIFVAFSELDQLHAGLSTMVDELQGTKTELEVIREEIEEEKQTQERLKRLEESQREISARQKEKHNQTLKKIEKEKSKIISTISEKKRDLEKIRQQITYLAQVGVSAEEAVRFGELAAIRTGVRASYLIAVLEVESRLGLNVGKGNWKTDMHPRDHEAFKKITAKLGLDPDTTKVSKAPSYGWGGAMGPAQFLPNTWLAYEDEIERLTGHNPVNPWNIEDAFTAAATKLARGGAASRTRAGEIRASKAYISGSGSCSKSICNRYANQIQEKADEIEQELSKNGKN